MAEADHCALVGWLGCALFVCLFVWSVCWLLVWLIGWLVCALFVCLVGWLFILLFVSLVDWLVGWLVGRLVGWLGCALVRIRSLSAGASVTLPSAQQRIIPMRGDGYRFIFKRSLHSIRQNFDSSTRFVWFPKFLCQVPAPREMRMGMRITTRATINHDVEIDTVKKESSKTSPQHSEIVIAEEYLVEEAKKLYPK